MDLDKLVEEKLGGISTYQVVLILVVSILPFGTGFMSQVSVFFSAVPDYRCSVPPIDNPEVYPNLTEEYIQNKLIPPGEPCFRYNYNLSSCAGNGNLSCLNETNPGTITCDQGYTYDDTYYEETTVSEWDLVCDKTTLDSLANSMYFVGVFVGSFIVGPMMDWFGRKRSMLILCICLIFSGLGVTFSPSYEVYIAMRVLTAMSGIPCFVAYFTYVSEISDKKSRSIVGMLAQMSTAFSHTVLPGIAYFLRDWRELCLCVSLLNLPYIVIYFFIPRSPRWLLTNGHEDEAKQIIKRYAKSKKVELNDEDWNLVVKAEKENIASAGEKKYFLTDLYKPSLMRIVSLDVIYIWFVVSMVFYGLTLNVTTLLGDPYVNAVSNGFVEIIGYFAFFPSVKLLGIRLTSSLSYFLGGACCLTTMLLGEFSSGNQAMLEASRWVAIAGKLFASVSFAVVYQYTAELYPTVARGTAMSMGSMSARIGSIIMPFTLQLQQEIPWLTQTIFGTLAIIAGATSLILPETSNADLTTSIDQAENFYRENMKTVAKLMGKTGVYHSKRDVEKSGEKVDKLTSYEMNYDDGEMYQQTSRL